MSDILDKWIDSLTLDQAKRELKKLHVKYEERGAAMRETGDIVRSLFVRCTCGGYRREISSLPGGVCK